MTGQIFDSSSEVPVIMILNAKFYSQNTSETSFVIVRVECSILKSHFKCYKLVNIKIIKIIQKPCRSANKTIQWWRK